jgi:hypothetical protein
MTDFATTLAIIGGFIAFLLAFAIGSNDAANCKPFVLTEMYCVFELFCDIFSFLFLYAC